MRRIIDLILVTFFISSSIFSFFPLDAFAAPFQNGSFEIENPLAPWVADVCDASRCTDLLTTGSTKLPGWSVEILQDDDLDWLKSVGTLTPQSGTYMIDLPGYDAGRGRISQTFDTYAGKIYQLRYYLHKRNGAPSSQLVLRICSDSSCTTSHISTTAGYIGKLITPPGAINTATNNWLLYTENFSPTSNQAYLSFENMSVTAGSSLLDNISIVQLPEISTVSNIYVYDPTASNLKGVPAQEIIYDWGLTNTSGSPDAGKVVLTVGVPSNVSFKIGSLTFVDGEIPGTPTGNPASSADTSPANSTLTVGTVEYSSVGTSGPWTYTPTGIYDANVRGIKVTPSGTMANGSTTTTGFRVYYTTQIN